MSDELFIVPCNHVFYISYNINGKGKADPIVNCQKCKETWVCIPTSSYVQDHECLPIAIGDALREGRDIEALVIFLEFNFENIGRIVDWLGFDVIKREEKEESPRIASYKSSQDFVLQNPNLPITEYISDSDLNSPITLEEYENIEDD